MHVIIVGCGRVGSTLATKLDDSGHSVVIIDRKPEAFNRLGTTFKGAKVTGIGFDKDVLISAGIEKADAVAAVTSGDNSNILIARVAREKFAVDKVVARIYDPKRAEIYERLGIATVATVKWTAERVLRRILPAKSAIEWTDPSSSVVLVERGLPDSLVGQKVLEISFAGSQICAIRRLGSAVIPDTKMIVQQGDIGYFTVTTGAIEDLDAQLMAGKS